MKNFTTPRKSLELPLVTFAYIRVGFPSRNVFVEKLTLLGERIKSSLAALTAKASEGKKINKGMKNSFFTKSSITRDRHICLSERPARQICLTYSIAICFPFPDFSAFLSGCFSLSSGSGGGVSSIIECIKETEFNLSPLSSLIKYTP